jgi:hypothetical protein
VETPGGLADGRPVTGQWLALECWAAGDQYTPDAGRRARGVVWAAGVGDGGRVEDDQIGAVALSDAADVAQPEPIRG